MNVYYYRGDHPDESNCTWAPSWDEETRARYKEEYKNDRPIIYQMHEEGSCEHCDLLRQLQREVDDETI